MSLLKLNTKLNNPYFLVGSNKNQIWLYSEIKAAAVKQEKERAPLNISLVIDRSGSMSGEKLDNVKKAVEFVIQNLNPTDYLSIVQYDNQVEVLSQTAAVRDKADLLRKVATIRPGGSTNLSGGLLEGYNQVKINRREGYVNRVLILTDGLANAGITEPSRLHEIAQRQFRENGIGLSTFGVGADFNEELIMQLAEHGGANYYFIETADQIPQLFAKELQGLLSVVAQNTKLNIEFPSEFVSVEKVYGYLFELNGNKLSINFNDVFSEEEKAVVIKFSITNPISLSSLFKVNLSFNDVVETLDRVTVQEELSLSPSRDAQLYENSIDRETIENAVFFTSSEQFKEVMFLSDSRRFDIAKSKLEIALNYLRGYVEMFPGSQRLQQLYTQMKDYLNNIPNMEMMMAEELRISQKFSKSITWQMEKRKF
jgi:Ca-activated chloride channel family protein